MDREELTKTERNNSRGQMEIYKGRISRKMEELHKSYRLVKK